VTRAFTRTHFFELHGDRNPLVAGRSGVQDTQSNIAIVLLPFVALLVKSFNKGGFKLRSPPGKVTNKPNQPEPGNQSKEVDQ
jgi:hypothetical protein